MPLINLIQEQRAAKQKLEQRARIAFFALVGSGAIGVLGYGAILLSGQALKSEITRLTVQLDKTRPVVDQIEANDRLTGGLKPRLDTLEKAQTDSHRWVGILKHFQTQTPEGTWLTGLQCLGNDPHKPVLVTITGTAKEQDPISEFILRTQNEPDLDDVALHYTQQKKSTSGLKAIDFEVGATLAGSAEAVAGTKEDKDLKTEAKS